MITERIRWFYRTNKHSGAKMPSVCACLIEKKDSEAGGIGIAICSDADNPSY